MSIRTGIMNTNSGSRLSQGFPPSIIGAVMVAGRPVAKYARAAKNQEQLIAHCTPPAHATTSGTLHVIRNILKTVKVLVH